MRPPENNTAHNFPKYYALEENVPTYFDSRGFVATDFKRFMKKGYILRNVIAQITWYNKREHKH